MDRRLNFHEILVDILGSRNVYFQPESNVTMKFPCIMYELDDVDATYADNLPYRRVKRYSVTYVDRSPTAEVPDQIALLPMAAFERAYKADNLNHTVYNVYF